jgi:hypothetical protein
MAFTSILGNPASVSDTGSYALLDAVYSNSAVILEDATEVLTGKKPTINPGLPLIGFSYKPDGGINLLKYEWSKYPYLNKQMLTHAAVKQTSQFSVTVVSPISTGGRGVVPSILTRELMVKLLGKYCDAGGKFTVLTLWGSMKHCLLTDLEGLSGDTMDGTLFKMHFERPNFDLTGADAQMSDFMSKAGRGAAV